MVIKPCNDQLQYCLIFVGNSNLVTVFSVVGINSKVTLRSVFKVV